MLLMTPFCKVYSQEAQKDSIKKAVSYCAQCFDQLDIRDRAIANKKVKVETLGLILENKNNEIQALRQARKTLTEQYYIEQKKAKKAKRRAFWRGLGTGAVLTAGGLIYLSLQ